jgi:hypothetical protein
VYVVSEDDGRRALAVLTMDQGKLILVWGSMRGVCHAVHAEMQYSWYPLRDDDDLDSDDDDGGGRCRVFDSVSPRQASSKPRWPVKIDANTFVFTCVGTTHPHYKGYPCDRCHVLVREAATDTWRSRPHVVVEAAVCLYDETEPRMWQRCAVTSDLRFEPPLVSWCSHNNSREDRTLWVRLPLTRRSKRDHLAAAAYLMTPRVVRLNKTTRTQLRRGYTYCGLEVVEQIHFVTSPHNYPQESAALADLGRNVAATSHVAARTIQRAWREAVSNPGLRVCHRRLLHEFEEGLP